MSLTLDLLNRTHNISGGAGVFGANFPIESCNADELSAFLQQEYEREINAVDRNDEKSDENIGLNTDKLVDCYTQKLDETVKLDRIMYSDMTGSAQDDNKPADSVELNILVEKSLLEYELNLATEKGNGINEKKYVFDFNTLNDLLPNIKHNDLLVLRHYVELLKLGYAPDMLNDDKSNNNDNLLMDDLISTLLSLAIQKNIEFPSPDLTLSRNNTESQMKWIKECIYKLVNVPDNVKENPLTIKEDIGIRYPTTDTNTALKDLQFAHLYLTKKYQEEVSQHSKYTNDMINKYKQCEELLRNSNNELSRVTNQLLRLEIENNELSKKLDVKTKELNELQMSNNLLKVDYLGLAPLSTLMSPPTSTSESDMQLASPSSLTSTLTSTSTSTSTSTVPESNVSVRILRMEFKKLVEQINSKFQKEIESEQIERRRLEELVALYKTKESSRGSVEEV